MGALMAILGWAGSLADKTPQHFQGGVGWLPTVLRNENVRIDEI